MVSCPIGKAEDRSGAAPNFLLVRKLWDGMPPRFLIRSQSHTFSGHCRSVGGVSEHLVGRSEKKISPGMAYQDGYFLISEST